MIKSSAHKEQGHQTATPWGFRWDQTYVKTIQVLSNNMKKNMIENDGKMKRAQQGKHEIQTKTKKATRNENHPERQKEPREQATTREAEKKQRARRKNHRNVGANPGVQ